MNIQTPMPSRLAWTHTTVIDRLREAMETLRAMPLTGCFPAGAQSAMPEPVQRVTDWFPQPGSPTFDADWRHMVERVADERHRFRGAPTAAAITRMEEAIRWRRHVPDLRYWRSLWAWLANARTSRVARRYGVRPITVRRWRQEALDQIVAGLNGWG